MDHEAESETIRPKAKAFVRHLEKLRDQLKEQALRDTNHYPDSIKCHLQVFDKLFADFEFAYVNRNINRNLNLLSYVSAMVPVKSTQEYDRQLDVAVLFSECLTRLKFILNDEPDLAEPLNMATSAGNKLMIATQM